MTIKKQYCILFYLVLCSVISAAQNTIDFTVEERQWIKNHPEIHFGYEKSWPPFEIYEEGEYKGISGEYIKEIERKTGIKMLPIPNITWDESITKIQDGKIKVVAVAAVTPKRLQTLVFTKPHIADFLVIVTHKDHEFISGLYDLENKTVCVPKGYYTIELLGRDYPKIKIKELSSIKACLEDVKNGKSNAVIGSLAVLSYYIRRDGYSDLKIASPTNYNQQKYSFAVSKDWIIFRDIVQKVFDHVTPTQQRDFYKKWLNPAETKQVIDVSNLKKYMAYSLFILAIIFLIFYLWNQSLQKQIRIKKAVENKLRSSLNLISEKNAEKEVLLKEIHHRVKNNLQMVNSMLNMQARSIEGVEAKEALLEAKSRVMAMSLIHKSLYESENLGKVNVKAYVKKLIESIHKLYANDSYNINFEVNVEHIVLDIDCIISLGLILNELIINSFKHAFADIEKGTIYITVQKESDAYRFEYKDSASKPKKAVQPNKKSIGLFLIDSLMQQLQAKNIKKGVLDYSLIFYF